ncbi:MAG TPA: GAF domain-containing protein, partial [Candidatus Acidoferrum sp.]
MNLAVAAANSRELPAFLAGFASRAAEMLDAEWGGVGEIIGSRVELYSPAQEFHAGHEVWDWLLLNIAYKRDGLQVLPLPENPGHCAFFPIYASDGELMGTLCLIRKEAEFTEAQEKLLTAL